MTYDQINPNNLISPKEKFMRGTYFFNRNAFIVSGEPLVLHCHYYNTLMYEAILSTSKYINVDTILRLPAAEVAFEQFQTYFSQHPLSTDDKITVVADYYRYCGLGTVNLSDISPQGGRVELENEHFADSWLELKKQRSADESSVSFFAEGYLVGALAAAFELPAGSFKANTIQCKSHGNATTVIEISLLENPETYAPSPAGGKLDKYHELQNPTDTKVDYLNIRKEMAGTAKLIASPSGVIEAFGVKLTRMYANYYCLVTYNWLKELEKQMGDKGTELAEELIQEMSNQCAFYAVGGLMQSDDWAQLTEDCLEKPEDYLHACVAFCNTFGWGFYEIVDMVPGEKMIVQVHSGYESNCYLARYGYNHKPVSYFAKGFLSGIMNLVYLGQVANQKVELNQQTYDSIFKNEKRFSARQLKSRTVGDKTDEIAVIPLQYIEQTS